MRKITGLAITTALFFVFGGIPHAEAAIYDRLFSIVSLGNTKPFIEEYWGEPEQRDVYDEDIGAEVDIYRSTSNEKDFYFVKYGGPEERVILFGEAVYPVYTLFKPDGGLNEARRLFNNFKSRVDVGINIKGDKDISLLEKREGEFYAWELRGDSEYGIKARLRGDLTMQGEALLPLGKVYHTVQKAGEKVFYTFSTTPYWKGAGAGEGIGGAGGNGLLIAMAGIILIALVLLFLIIRKKKKRGIEEEIVAEDVSE